MNPDTTAVNGSAKKQFGVVYTPDAVVSLMLDALPSLKGVAVCDPACGNGQFLAAVVERVCARMRRCRSEAARNAYRATLQQLTGFDISRSALRDCRARLNAVVRKHGCGDIPWRLYPLDAIERRAWKEHAGSFDCVVGNPPYVRIQHLEAERRERINRGRWRLMSGCSDLFILFFEMGLELLKPQGRLIFITPNSWMKTESGRALRECLRARHEIRSIIDFGEHQLFDNATTYTAIVEIRKGRKSGANGHIIPARKCTGFAAAAPEFSEGQVDTRDAAFWAVLSSQEQRFINRIRARPKRLFDVADIHVGIQTLADDVFILPAGNAANASLMPLDIEESITRRIYKASTMKNGRDHIDRRIIYPYRRGKLLPEEELRESYPKAYAHLLRHKRRLLARDKGAFDAKKWYGFGRDVAIVSGFGEKILTSAMNPTPNFQHCVDADSLFYAGYAVKPKAGVCLTTLLAELNSETMDRYIRLFSRPYRNGWYSYAKSFIASFPVSENVRA